MPLWSNDPSWRSEPPDAYKDKGFDPSLPLPLRFLNWILWKIDTAVDTLTARFAVQHNSTTGAHTNVTATSVTVASGTAGFDSAGRLTHRTTKGCWSLSAQGFAAEADEADVNTVASQAFSGVTYQFVEPDIAAAGGGANVAVRVPVPVGATISRVSLRVCTRTGGTGGGGYGMTLRAVRNTLSGGTVEESLSLSGAAPAAGTVLLDQDTSPGISEIALNTDVFVVLAITNGLPDNDSAIGFINLDVEWTFTSPGDDT